MVGPMVCHRHAYRRLDDGRAGDRLPGTVPGLRPGRGGGRSRGWSRATFLLGSKALGGEPEPPLRGAAPSSGRVEREVVGAVAQGVDLLVVARDGDRSRLGPPGLGRFGCANAGGRKKPIGPNDGGALEPSWVRDSSGVTNLGWY
jgi:hypothetical protein